jgi:hypothetical protein
MTVRFLDAAKTEFDDAVKYYDEQRSGLGLNFGEEVEQTLERIAHYLTLGRDCRCGCADA